MGLNEKTRNSRGCFTDCCTFVGRLVRTARFINTNSLAKIYLGQSRPPSKDRITNLKEAFAKKQLPSSSSSSSSSSATAATTVVVDEALRGKVSFEL